jgi:hypothetical protein
MSFQVLMQQRAWRSWPAILEPWLSKIRVFDISVSGELMEQVVLARVEDAGGHGCCGGSFDPNRQDHGIVLCPISASPSESCITLW